MRAGQKNVKGAFSAAYALSWSRIAFLCRSEIADALSRGVPCADVLGVGMLPNETTFLFHS
jgi:hypothetical protein